MNNDGGSWVRRAKFSTTVCHRWDSLRRQHIPLVLPHDIHPPLKLGGADARSVSRNSSVAERDVSKSQPKLRSKSPLPATPLPETFKEARSDHNRRSTTPGPRRKEPDKTTLGGLIYGGGPDSRKGGTISTADGMKKSDMVRVSERIKGWKDSSWTNYFDHGGRVSAVDELEEWTVDLSKLFLGLRFASGAHSKLYHGIYNDQPVAVKMIRIPDDDENGSMAARLEKQFIREVTLLSRLHHPNVIKLVAACRKPPVFCIITEYLSGGSLRAYLHKLERKALPLEKLVAISLDMARGMEYVHSQGVIHRDIKPENILFDKDFHLTIVDFGIACESAFCDYLAEDSGTYRWMAPEMIKHKAYCRKVDVYSFGLLLWEMVTGTIPYEDMTPIQAAYAVVNKDLRPVIPQNCPAALQALIEQCWSLLPEKRPDFWQIVKVLEQFEVSLTQNGTLDLGHDSTFLDHKKRLVHWIHKLSHGNPNSVSSCKQS